MPPPTPRRAVLYGRVSKADARRSRSTSKETVSVDRQIAIMTEWAHRDSVTIVGVFRDDGISASTFARGKAREGWRDTLSILGTGKVTELWAYEVSRASRERSVWAALINTCIVHDLWMSIGGKLHDPADPDDAFMLDLMGGLAVRESALTSKRIKDDFKVRALEGKVHGKIPYGYRREYDPRTRELVAQVRDPVTAPIVEEMARRVLAGESRYSIANDLHDRGVPCPQAHRALRNDPAADVSGMRWHSGEVRDQLLSPAAAGLRVHNGAVVATAIWEAIISPADRERLKAALAGDGRPQWFGPARHLLTGIAECGVCGSRLRRVKNRGYPSYSCPGPLKRGDSCVTRVQGPLDAMVAAYAVQRLLDPELLAQAARAKAGDQQRASVAERELADLRATRAEFVAAAKRPGGRGAAAALEIIADYDVQIEACQARMAASSGLPAVVLDAAGADADAKWEAKVNAGDVVWCRQVLRALVRVRLHRSARPRGVRGFDPSTVEIIDL